MPGKNQRCLPTHSAYSVVRRDGEDESWLKVGLVFPHADGAGFNVVLQAYPLDGKLVCRSIMQKDRAGRVATAALDPSEGRDLSSLEPTPG
jgi:hypothetical protein